MGPSPVPRPSLLKLADRVRNASEHLSLMSSIWKPDVRLSLSHSAESADDDHGDVHHHSGQPVFVSSYVWRTPHWLPRQWEEHWNRLRGWPCGGWRLKVEEGRKPTLPFSVLSDDQIVILVVVALCVPLNIYTWWWVGCFCFNNHQRHTGLVHQQVVCLKTQWGVRVIKCK